jgi:hypothetical protein
MFHISAVFGLTAVAVVYLNPGSALMAFTVIHHVMMIQPKRALASSQKPIIPFQEKGPEWKKGYSAPAGAESQSRYWQSRSSAGCRELSYTVSGSKRTIRTSVRSAFREVSYPNARSGR